MRLLQGSLAILLLAFTLSSVEGGRKRRVKATVPTQIEPPPDTTEVT